MADQLAMELRSVDVDARTITGVTAPYGEISLLAGDPAGERMMPGAFAKSIRQREARIPLCLNHDHSRAVGMSRSWTDDASALAGVFAVRGGPAGDEVLEDCRDGYLPGLSVGFAPLNVTRGADGVREVREAKLVEVSLVLIAAYDGARVLAVRTVQDMDALLAPFRNPPAVDLSPFAAPWG